jgi:hypothetical protein
MAALRFDVPAAVVRAVDAPPSPEGAVVLRSRRLFVCPRAGGGCCCGVRVVVKRFTAPRSTGTGCFGDSGSSTKVLVSVYGSPVTSSSCGFLS